MWSAGVSKCNNWDHSDGIPREKISYVVKQNITYSHQATVFESIESNVLISVVFTFLVCHDCNDHLPLFGCTTLSALHSLGMWIHRHYVHGLPLTISKLVLQPHRQFLCLCLFLSYPLTLLSGEAPLWHSQLELAELVTILWGFFFVCNVSFNLMMNIMKMDMFAKCNRKMFVDILQTLLLCFVS